MNENILKLSFCKPNKKINKLNKQKIISSLLKFLVSVSAVITIFFVLSIVGYILVKGIPQLRLSLFSFTYNSNNVSLFPALVNTILITFISLLISIPIGIGSAIYLIEYAKKDNKLVKIIRVTTETLSGIPSIVYGLFGLLFFVTYTKLGMSLLSGALTLSIMVLPLIMRTTEEALISVPQSYREGSFGLGAGKLRTIFKIVLPSAIPGILSGVILAIGRIVGESAALIYTAGTVPQIPENILGSGRTLSVHMYVLSNEGLYINQSYGTCVILLLTVFGINVISSIIAKKISKGF